MPTKDRKHNDRTPPVPRVGAWDVILAAVERGWATTLRLCVIFAMIALVLAATGR